MARSRRVRIGGLAATLLALAAGCTAAPIAGKPCPCDTTAGYMCCAVTNTCVSDAAQCVRPRCTPTQLADETITQDGGPHSQPDGGPDAVEFVASGQHWVSYTYPPGATLDQATLTMTPDGSGFHVTAHVTSTYAGVGLSFLSDDQCIDGTNLTGVEFEFSGDLGGHVLKFSIMADDDVSDRDDERGTCTGGSTMCFGPRKNVDPNMSPNMFAFGDLISGMPDQTLDRQHIMKLQWEVEAASTGSDADFTISNVQFY